MAGARWWPFWAPRSVPYLFFWQAGQEIEEEKARGQSLLASRYGATKLELADRRIDVGIGTFFSNVAMFFIILTTASTLHQPRHHADRNLARRGRRIATPGG